MTTYDLLAKERFRKALRLMDELSFPAFLTNLRVAIGLSRTMVAHDCKMNYQRLYCIEKGLFEKPVSDINLHLLASYYGIDKNLLKTKMLTYLVERQ